MRKHLSRADSFAAGGLGVLVAALSACAAAAPLEPELSSMAVATSVSSKMGAPVDLRYQFDGSVQAGTPVTLHLAAVPRVAGTNLSVSVKKEPGVQTSAAEATAGQVRAQKAAATTAYRQQLSVTRMSNGPTELRVLVTMDLPQGSAFSYYSIPLNGAPAASKQNPATE